MSTRLNYASTLSSYENVNKTKKSGDVTLSPKRTIYNIGSYEVCVLLDDARRFLGVESVKVHKSFYDAKRLPTSSGRSVEEIVTEFFREIEE